MISAVDSPVPPRWALWPSVGWLAALILLGIAASLLVRINRRISQGHSGDFRHFYYAAEAMRTHHDLYRSGTQGYLYPPLIAFVYTPLVPLGFIKAQRVMLLINGLLVGCGVYLATRAFFERFSLPRGWPLLVLTALLGVLLNVDKVRSELQMFQTNATMFFMFALSLRLLDRRPALAGVPLGFIFNIKYLSIGMIPWLLIRRRWSTAISCAVSTIVFALLPGTMSGWKTNLSDLKTAYGGLLHMVGVSQGQTEQANVEDIRDLLSCSITSAMARSGLSHGNLKVAAVMAAAVAVFAAGAFAVMYRRHRVPVLQWPGRSWQTAQPLKGMIAVEMVVLVAVTLCFSPQTNTRHLLLALLITLPAAALLITGRPGIGKPFLGLAMAILFVGLIFPFGDRWPHLSGWWFGHGGQCWCLLIACTALINSSLRQTTPVSPPVE